MQISPLSLNEAALTGFTHKVLLTVADLTAKTGTSGYVNIFPDSGAADSELLVQSAAIKVVTPFGGSAATLTCAIGDSGSATKALAASDVKAAAKTIYAVRPATLPATVTATSAIRATFTAGSGNISDFTAGAIAIYLQLADTRGL